MTLVIYESQINGSFEHKPLRF